MSFGEDGADRRPIRKTTASTAAVALVGLSHIVVLHQDVFYLARHIVHIYGSKDRIGLVLGLFVHTHRLGLLVVLTDLLANFLERRRIRLLAFIPTNISGLLLFCRGLLAAGLIFLALEEVGKDRLRHRIARPFHLFFFQLELTVARDDWLTGQLLLLADNSLAWWCAVLLRLWDICRGVHGALRLLDLLRSITYTRGTVILVNTQVGRRLLHRELL